MEACFPDRKGACGASVLRLRCACVVQARDIAVVRGSLIGVSSAAHRRPQPTTAVDLLHPGALPARAQQDTDNFPSGDKTADPFSTIVHTHSRRLSSGLQPPRALLPHTSLPCLGSISHTTHHGDQPAAAVPPRRPHQAVAAGAPTSRLPQPALAQPGQPDIAVAGAIALRHRVARVAGRRHIRRVGAYMGRLLLVLTIQDR